MSDYELELKIKNLPLLTYMRRGGHRTAKSLSDATGVQPNTIGDMLSMKYPLYKLTRKSRKMTIRSGYQRLADYFMCEPKELCPEAHWHDGLPKCVFTAHISSGTLMLGDARSKSLDDPAAFIEHLEADEKLNIEDMLSGLSGREQTVMLARFRDGKTFAEIGKDLGVGREWVRQIEGRTLHKMRYSDKAGDGMRELLDSIDEGDA